MVPLISIKNFYKINFLQKWKVKRIIDKNYNLYFAEKKKKGGFNFPILEDDSDFFNKLYTKFLERSRKEFDKLSISSHNSATCWCYRGNKVDMGIRQPSWWHNHSTTSTINGVYYMEVYNDGISFMVDNNIYDYLPENGELIIFPSTLVHAAQPNTLQKYRYSVNMEILTTEPSHQLFKKLFQ